MLDIIIQLDISVRLTPSDNNHFLSHKKILLKKRKKIQKYEKIKQKSLY